VAQFKRGDFSTCEAPRPGRPKTVTTLEIIDQIHMLILEGRQISAKSIIEQLGISSETLATTQPMVQSHIPEDLNPQQYHCENFKSCTEISMTATCDSSKNGLLRMCVPSPFEHVQHPLCHNETSKYIDK
jgi:hypothetical protein